MNTFTETELRAAIECVLLIERTRSAMELRGLAAHVRKIAEREQATADRAMAILLDDTTPEARRIVQRAAARLADRDSGA